MDKVIEQVQQWEFYKALPDMVHGFQLESELVREESRLYLFSYCCQSSRRSFYAFYDKATKDFMAHTVIGLFDFCDIQFITTDLTTFERMLTERMDSVLRNLREFDPGVLGSVFTAKQIMQWDWSSLPESLFGFNLFIRPSSPLKTINGSYILIDYCDFAEESNLTVYYNIYRDEFFSERRVRRLPEMLTVFDAKNLADLTEKLKMGLFPELEKMRNLLNEHENDKKG